MGVLILLLLVACSACAMQPRAPLPEYHEPATEHPSGRTFSADYVDARLSDGMKLLQSRLELDEVPVHFQVSTGVTALLVRAEGFDLVVTWPAQVPIREVALQSILITTFHEVVEWSLSAEWFQGSCLYSADTRLRWVGEGAAEVLSHQTLQLLFKSGRLPFLLRQTPALRDGYLDLSAWQAKQVGQKEPGDALELSYRYGASRMLIDRWQEAARAKGLENPFATLREFCSRPQNYNTVIAFLERSSDLPVAVWAQRVDCQEVHEYLRTH